VTDFNRSSPDAQIEIKYYAEKIGEMMADLFPESWAALTEEQTRLTEEQTRLTEEQTT
jgi:thymidylate synthase ThyX